MCGHMMFWKAPKDKNHPCFLSTNHFALDSIVSDKYIIELSILLNREKNC